MKTILRIFKIVEAIFSVFFLVGLSSALLSILKVTRIYECNYAMSRWDYIPPFLYSEFIASLIYYFQFPAAVVMAYLSISLLTTNGVSFNLRFRHQKLKAFLKFGAVILTGICSYWFAMIVRMSVKFAEIYRQRTAPNDFDDLSLPFIEFVPYIATLWLIITIVYFTILSHSIIFSSKRMEYDKLKELL